MRLSRRTRGIILQNFAGTIVVDSVGIALAAVGVLTPVMAALIHVTSELAFILNSARLVPRGPAGGLMKRLNPVFDQTLPLGDLQRS